MDLPDRRRGDRHPIEVDERALERKAELGLDDLFDLFERERPHVVLERAKLRDDVRRDDVGPGREQLPELHEGRAELLEHLAEVNATLGRCFGFDRRALPPRQQVGQPVLVEEVPEPVADGDLRNLRQAPQIPLSRLRRHGVSVARVRGKPC